VQCEWATLVLRRGLSFWWAVTVEGSRQGDKLDSSWAEDFADFAGKALQGERLLQEGFWGVGGGCGESVLGVAGEVEDFEGGAREEKLLYEFVAAEAGHDNVGNDEVNGIGVAGGQS